MSSKPHLVYQEFEIEKVKQPKEWYHMFVKMFCIWFMTKIDVRLPKNETKHLPIRQMHDKQSSAVRFFSGVEKEKNALRHFYCCPTLHTQDVFVGVLLRKTVDILIVRP